MSKSLRRWREEALLTQGELAEQVGVPYQRIGEWERGENRPRPASQRKLALALGISGAELLAALDATQAEREGKAAA